jgi:hypothetical protein
MKDTNDEGCSMSDTAAMTSASMVDVRYLGFDQVQSGRAFHFDVFAEPQPKKRCTVTADLRLFSQHRVGVQEGPALCAGKLIADLQIRFDGAHELTAEDLRAYTSRRRADEERRAATRRSRRAEER